MTLEDSRINIFSGVKTLIYMFCAIMAFTATYPFYKAIMALPNASTTAAITMSAIWWIISFTVVYMGTWWTYTKKVKQE